MTLQTALIVAGIVLLLLVVAYNQWQIRKARRPRALQPEDDLPPMREPVVSPVIKPEVSAKLHEPSPEHQVERREPTLSASPLDAAAVAARMAASSADADDALADEVAVAAAPSSTHAPHAPHAAAGKPGHAEESGQPAGSTEPHDAADHEEHAEQVKPKQEPAPAKEPQPEPVALDGQPTPAVIDPLIDCIVPLHLERKSSGDRILPLTGRLRRAGTKQVHIEGLRSEANAWEPVTAGHQYEDLQVAVQLANRGGALNALEFSEFVNAVEALAEALDASAELPDMTETVANGRELDAFAASCDVQLGVNVISDGAPWSAAYVQTVATQDGLVLSRDGTRFTRYQANAEGVQRALFTLQFGDTNFLRDDLTAKAGRQITLLLDVPSAAQATKPFKTVCEYGYSLAQRMGAQLVDDNMRPLSESSFVAIFGQLQTLYDKLEARGMPAGSPVTLRLFSL
ncbi:cell division protein ZipA C-terminal FtsZ-binding domain-containing protein [Cupriavidus sp. CV2]|uniref:cell division protein ZipA C-terminal FtsZ-binding domain-containing protein n=1 Tax=Cupriavidus ulmosensis TaxID=3065913 RepID=UPI00296AFED5|nr:cell division protein ZipA C-terminal FtsZ-binding domain-containing protein [Cupriavidus sp. CV2]MDW3681834.1 cell division protein ZipA C-terminal FtsZ-binding domain-containing protein [Cupriavidus sp. CV2]